jgi:thiamine-monophosphate kinase
MNVSEIGEFGLIELLAGMVEKAADKDSPARKNLVIGIGDDAAVWHGDSSLQLATSDTLVQDIHFSLESTSWEELGWRAMAANLSDIAAMGGVPRYALVSLSLPGSTGVDDVSALYRGMIELARQYGAVIIGGDMSSAPVPVITITVLGSSGNGILTRATAVPGDKIAVTGYLGTSAAGLEVLKGNINPDSESADIMKKAFLKPSPRVNEGRLLVETGVKSAIDTSDGLISDLRHICKSSRVGARIEAGLVPVHPAVRDSLGQKALKLALTGGEDYELVFTASGEIIESVRKALSCPVTVIGEVTDDNTGELLVFDENGNRYEVTSGGWEHFQ